VDLYFVSEREPFILIPFSEVDGSGQVLYTLKALGARKGNTGYRVPALAMNVDILSKIFLIPPKIQAFISSHEQIPKEPPIISRREKDFYPFQRHAVRYLIQDRFPGYYLSCSPGLGKTAIAIVAASLLGLEHILIICPKILRRHWLDELERWEGTSGYDAWGESPDPHEKWVISTYETVRGRTGAYRSQRWDLVIIDESTRSKNRGSKTFISLCKVRTASKRMWLLSGGPVTRFYDDLWAQFNLIWPQAFFSYWRFANRFCFVEETIWGKNIVGNQLIRPGVFDDFMLNVNMSDVLELPERTIETFSVVMDPEQQRISREIVTEFKASLRNEETINIPLRVAQMTRLLQVSSSLANLFEVDVSTKADTVLELLETVERPVLIWTFWRPGAGCLLRRLRKEGLNVELLIGGDEAPEYKLKRFKDGKLDVLILSLGVGKFGLTLIEAKTVIYVDVTFDFEALLQSSYRVYRIGLDHPVRIILLQSMNSIDSIVLANLRDKARGLASLTNEQLLDLLEDIS